MRYLLVVFMALLCTPVLAQTGQVQGVAGVGSAVPIRPVAVGGKDGSGNARFVAMDTNGNVQVQGSAASGASPVGNPVLVGGYSSILTVQPLSIDNGRGLNIRIAAGQQAVGSAADGSIYYPAMMGLKDTSGNVQSLFGDTTGRIIVVGAAASGSAKAGNPILIAGQDGTNAVTLFTDSAGRVRTRAFVDPIDIPVASGVKTSNGTTAVAIAAAGSAGQYVYLGKLVAYNTSTTVVHTFTLISSGGTVLAQCTLSAASSTAAGGNVTFDADGLYQSAINEGLSFKIDAGGSATDVILTAVTVTK